ncbi:MAG TPA: EAL domain-containing protein [Terriglobales bacterium]|nr:EAL domain-containing protein [Terriglobales bacterium]
MKQHKRQLLSNWVMLGLTVAAATASAIAIMQFRQQADLYRQAQLSLTHIEGQIHLFEGLKARSEADRNNAQVRGDLDRSRADLVQSFREIGELKIDTSLQDLARDGEMYALSAAAMTPVRSRRKSGAVYNDLSRRVRQASDGFNEAAQKAIWKSDLEASLGLLAFTFAILAIIWRFGAVRRKADLANAEQRALQQSEQRFRTLTDKSSDVIAILNAQGSVLYLSSSIEHVLGYSKDVWTGRKIYDLIHPDDVPMVSELLHSVCVLSDAKSTTEMRCRHANGNWRYMEVTARNDLATQNIGGVVINAKDITERKRAEEKLQHDASHDPLTGLPNRTLLWDRLQRAVNRARRQEDFTFALLFIDLDRFKVVNDSLGHLAGDRLIIDVALRLGQCVRQTLPEPQRRAMGDDTIARIGGDEFTVLIEEIRDPADAIRVAERVSSRLEMPFIVGGVEVFTSASIGIAISSRMYTSADEVLRDADIAMYRAKSNGGARFELFDSAMHSNAVRRLTLETDMRRALDRNEFEVFYQPIVALQDAQIHGVEALIRWRHPERGLIGPSEFISVAEDMGLIVLIGRWMLRQACRQVAEFQRQYPSVPPLTVSVNISAKEFAQPDLVEQVRTVLAETQLQPGTLKLEITESVAMGDVERVAATLGSLKDAGVRISIDDFGTGYSSLSYLRKFPIDTLKIDRSFVSGLGCDEESRQIVRTIASLAHNLSMEVIAEGTETEAQVEELRVMSCKYAQGYFFSRPVNAESLLKMLADGGESCATPQRSRTQLVSAATA